MHHVVLTGRLFSVFGRTFYLKHQHRIKVEAGSSMFLSTIGTHLPGSWCHGQEHYNMNLHCPKLFKYFLIFSTFVPCILILSKFYYQLMHKIIALKEY